jgi:hypothetical protein
MSKPFGLLADLHLHRWTAFASTTPEGLNSRLVGLLGEIERAAQEVKAAGGNTLILAGDIFHVRGSVAPTVLNPTQDTFRKIGYEHGVHIEIMPGNHDLEGRDTTRLGSAVTALEQPCDMDGDGGVSVRNEIQLLNVGNSSQYVLMVPWIESVEELKKLLPDVLARATVKWNVQVPPLSEINLILHAPIDGVIEGLPAHGLSPDFLAGLGFKRVFAGHYHNHRQMHPGGVVYAPITNPTVVAPPVTLGEVWSIGALAHHTWSDVGSRAGFLIVHEDRVDYRKSHLPAFIDLSKLAATIEPDDLPLVVDKNYVRVRVAADKAKEVEAARKELLDMGALAVLVEAQPKAPVRAGDTRATVAAGASLEQSVGDFVKTMKELGDDQARKDAAAREALDILTAAGAEA